MLAAIARKLFGSANDRVLRTIQPLVAAIKAAEPDVVKLTDSELQGRTPWLKERLAPGEGRSRPPGEAVPTRPAVGQREPRPTPLQRRRDGGAPATPRTTL